MPAVISECHVSQRERSGARAQGGLPCGIGYVAVISSPSRLKRLSIPIGRKIYAEVDVRSGGGYGTYGALNPTVLTIRIPCALRPLTLSAANLRNMRWH